MIQGHTYVGGQVVLDEEQFIECVFNGTRLIYCGGDFAMSGNRLSNIQLEFRGAARRTIRFLYDLYHDDAGSRAIAEQVMADIRGERPPPAASGPPMSVRIQG